MQESYLSIESQDMNTWTYVDKPKYKVNKYGILTSIIKWKLILAHSGKL